MNKEKCNQIIDEVYENYKTIHKHAIRTEGDRSQLVIELLEKQLIYPKEEFINKIKTDSEFSNKWGLKIEERELSDKERVAIFMENKRTNKFEDNNCDIPTKLITLTYNNETIESYE